MFLYSCFIAVSKILPFLLRSNSIQKYSAYFLCFFYNFHYTNLSHLISFFMILSFSCSEETDSIALLYLKAYFFHLLHDDFFFEFTFSNLHLRLKYFNFSIAICYSLRNVKKSSLSGKSTIFRIARKWILFLTSCTSFIVPTQHSWFWSSSLKLLTDQTDST